MFAPTVALSTLLHALAPEAHATSAGVVVTLSVAQRALPTRAAVVLSAPGEEPVLLALADNGQPPDVSPGDGQYAGTTKLTADAYTVRVELDGEPVGEGTVSWSSSDTTRDLDVTVDGTSVLVEARSPRPPPPAGDAAAAGGGNLAPAAPGTAAPTGAASGPSTPLLVGGALVLAIVGAAALTLRRAPGPAPATPRSFTRLAEAPFFGPGSPVLDDGLVLCAVDDDTPADAARPLLAALARHHRVLVVAPADTTVPGVSGGGVYRAEDPRPTGLRAALAAIEQPGHRPAVFVYAADATPDALRAWAESLPPGVGGLCLAPVGARAPGMVRVHLRRDGEGWAVAWEGGRARLDADGTRGPAAG